MNKIEKFFINLENKNGEIKTHNGNKVYYINDVPTVIKSINCGIGHGYIIDNNGKSVEKFVAKSYNIFVFGDSFDEVYDKLYEKDRIKEYSEIFINKFVEHFKLNRKYNFSELAFWHRNLTGACIEGIMLFCKDNNINFENDKMTVQEFLNISKNSYGKSIVKNIAKIYKLKLD